MNYKTLQLTVVIVLIAINVVLVFSVTRLKAKFNTSYFRINKEVDNLQALISSFYNSNKLVYDAQSVKIDNKILLMDEQGNLNKLDDLVQRSEKLIYRVRQSDCSACYETEFQNMRKYLKKETQDEILILTSFNSKREFLAFKNTYAQGFKLYNIENGILPSTLEKINSPYFFIIRPEAFPEMVYVPDKANPILSKAYLESINIRLAI